MLTGRSLIAPETELHGEAIATVGVYSQAISMANRISTYAAGGIGATATRLTVPRMAAVGWAYGFTWRPVMRIGEAIVFRTLLLSLPSWLAWTWALRMPSAEGNRRFFPSRRLPFQAPVSASGPESAGSWDELAGPKGTTHA